MRTHVVAKTLVFNSEGKLLLLTRSMSDDHRPGGLDLPGGKVEDGEEVLAGAVREAQEEAGLVIHPQDMHWVYADTVIVHKHESGESANVVRITFAVRIEDSVVALSHEHEDYKWYEFDDAMQATKGTRYPAILQHMAEHGIARNLWRQAS